MHLTLYIPGLFGPEARFSREFVPEAPALEVILSRASRIDPPAGSRHGALSSLFGLGLAADADAPVAAVSRIVDAGEAGADWWLRADPVHLRADRSGLVLIDAGEFRLDAREAQALAADLRGLLAEVGELDAPRPDRWYLRLKQPPDLQTRDLDEVSGRDIRHALPGGAGAPAWHRLLNEIQVRLHSHEINRLREQRGEAPVNSVWFWGGGTAPAGMVPIWSRVFGGGVYAEGLARLSCTPYTPRVDQLAAALAEPGAERPVLVVLDECATALHRQDLHAWSEGIAHLESAWFEPCLRLLRSRVLRRLDLFTQGFGFRLSPRSLWRIWRRRTPLGQFISGAIAPANDVNT